MSVKVLEKVGGFSSHSQWCVGPPNYAKYKPHGEASQRTLTDSYSATAWEAAAKLAYHLEVQQQLPAKEVRAPRHSSEVSRPRRL